MPRLACLIGTLAALCWAAPASAAQPRIINGDAASAGEYPAQGFLELDTSEGTFVCGGSLVSNRWFLTAGHCATDIETDTPLDASAFTVKLGRVNRSAFTVADAHQVDARVVHANYDHTDLDNDVALLRLATPGQTSLGPIRLIETGESSLWETDNAATVVGWGVTETARSPTRCSRPPSRWSPTPAAPASWGSDFTPPRWCARAAATLTPVAVTLVDR